MLTVKFALPSLSFRSSKAVLTLFIGLSLMLASALAQAATITVNSSDQAINPSGVCTLRGAVGAINNQTDSNSCTNTSADTYGTNNTINFSIGTATITLATSANNHIRITRNLTIDGGGTITLDGNNTNRIFITSGAAGSMLTVKGLIFQNGNVLPAGGLGGAIEVMNTEFALTVQDCTFLNNQAYYGGAIDFSGGVGSSATVRVERSTFTNNLADRRGGAIWAYNLTVSDSTFSGNHSDDRSGAIWANAGTISNSTFIGNTAVNSGGAIRTELSLNATYLTLVNNTAPNGAAIHVLSGTASLQNSLIVGDNSVTSAQCAVGGVLSSGTNLEWRQGIGSENTCLSSVPVITTALLPGDIVATVLANNGGTTETLALPNTSAAIDAGDPTVAAVADQRGSPRPIGSAPDVGAYEAAAAPPTPIAPVIIYPVTQAFVTPTSDHGIEMRTIYGLIAPRPVDIGFDGAYFVFAYLPPTATAAPDTVWYLDSALNWHQFVDCRITAAYLTTRLDVLRGMPIIPVPTDLSAFKGTQLYFGYGLGGYGAPSGTACNDMIARQYYKLVYTVN